MPLIHIAEWPQPIEAGRHRILEAALDAGVPFPHGCGSGECGTCKCRLLEGEIKSDRFSPEALSEEDIDQGLILACRARPLTDVRVQWLAAGDMSPMTRLDARVARIDRAAHDVMVLTVALERGQDFAFRAGQFAKLRFGKLPARSYSMANLPGQRELVFHIRVLPEGRVSQHVAASLRPGDKVEVRGPFGEAYWEAGARTPQLLLLAGGTGMAPIMSVLDAALGDGQDGQGIHVYHGVRTEHDLYMRDQLQRRIVEHGIRFVPVYADGGPGRTGMLHEAVKQDFADLRASLIYSAGPPPMVDAVRQMAAGLGAAPQRIKADPFHPSEPEKRSLWERVTAWSSTSMFGGL
jgi:CDP-4-dehydro-6-deoxyglucose reductase/ferredoxin-NAD(P)+ reductase (naphthalene dioxygenase ferredoxin-specific)